MKLRAYVNWKVPEVVLVGPARESAGIFLGSKVLLRWFKIFKLLVAYKRGSVNLGSRGSGRKNYHISRQTFE